MKQRPSRTFIVAGVVVGLSLFVILAMLFYGPADYSERSEQIAEEDGLRFHIASVFFGSFGIGAYVGWLIILTWAIIVFFRESVGELALRAVSLAVVVISGAALAELLGSGHLGGDLGYAIGSVLEASLGSALGVLLIGAIFGVSIVLATDYGFLSYYKEARNAIAVAEEDVPVAEEPGDLVKRIDKAASEVEAEIDEEIPPAWPPPKQEAEEMPISLETKPPIEEEEFDDILDVAKKAETGDGDTAVEPESETDPEIAVPEEEEPEAELLIDAEPLVESAPEEVEILEDVEAPEEVEEEPTVLEEEPTVLVEETPTARLASALDALLGPAEETEIAEETPEPEVAEVPEVPVIEVVVEEDEPEVAVEEDEPELAVDLPDPEPEPEPAFAEDPEVVEVPTVLIDDEIYVVDDSLHEVAEEEPETTEAPITEEMPAVTEAPGSEPELVEVELPASAGATVSREREVIEELIEEADVEVVDEIVDVSAGGEQVEDSLLPFMGDDEEKKTGVLRSFFRRKKSKKREAAPDPLLPEAASLVLDRGRASVVHLQRRLDIGHTRASRIVEALEQEGLVGPLLESGSREVLMSRIEWETRG